MDNLLQQIGDANVEEVQAIVAKDPSIIMNVGVVGQEWVRVTASFLFVLFQFDELFDPTPGDSGKDDSPSVRSHHPVSRCSSAHPGSL